MIFRRVFIVLNMWRWMSLLTVKTRINYDTIIKMDKSEEELEDEMRR